VLHTDIDQFSDMQFVQLTGELLQGKHGAPCIAVGIRQRTVSCFECLSGPVQPSSSSIAAWSLEFVIRLPSRSLFALSSES
jgi:hypothetical protein